MKHYDFFQFLQEKKDHIIKKIPNLTEEQKKVVIEFFAKHPNYENKLGTKWNKPSELTWKDFESLIKEADSAESAIKKAVSKGIEGIVEGVDYVDFGTVDTPSFGEIHIYRPLTWKGSRVLASDQVEPKLNPLYPDISAAKWCIAYSKSDEYWKQYSEGNNFLFLFGLNVPTLKVALQMGKYSAPSDFKYLKAFLSSYYYISYWDALDNEIDEDDPNFSEFVECAYEALNDKEMFEKVFSADKKYIDEELDITREWIRLHSNREGLVDVEGTVKIEGHRYYDEETDSDLLAVTEGRVVIPFGHVSGSFLCNNNQLTTLENCPRTLGGTFTCSFNQLTTMEHAPEVVGRGIFCDHNELISLKGCPERVDGYFECDHNQLETLEGAPKYVGASFDVSHNKLKNLKGGPERVEEVYDCKYNELETLEGISDYIGEDLDCRRNQLTSLEGLSNYVGGNVYCRDNKVDIEPTEEDTSKVRGRIYNL